MITIKKIRLFNKYNRDIDGFCRCGLVEEKKLLGMDDWSLLDDFCQNIELIQKGLASQDFKNQTLERVREACDEESYRNLTGS